MGAMDNWNNRVLECLNALYSNQDVSFSIDDISCETPPNPKMGDLAFPMFAFAKKIRKSPLIIATEVSNWFNSNVKGCNTENNGPYLNLFIDMGDFSSDIINKVLDEGDKYGYGDLYRDKKIMVEFSCPNTNKPLHLGHLRNDSLGSSVSQILKAAGADVRKVNLINNRGIHICKSMLAYQEFGEGKTPESEGIKSDHFVGDYYVKYDQWSKKDPEADKRVREMLLQWENGDKETLELWNRMNEWTISGIEETYKNTGISFDDVYFESNTYSRGKVEVQKGLDKNKFYKDDEGTVWVDLEEIGLDQKVLLRNDGTSLYLTQDLGTAIARHDDWPFDSLVYVVASEQQYHFKVLFHVLDKLGYKWASQLVHLSYGMVNLPDGKMKSREGTVVDADDLFSELSKLAKIEIISKGRESDVGNINSTADAIALGALNYYLLSTSPTKDMIFNPKDSIAFQGSTGPYVQYMGARISSMLRKYDSKVYKDVKFDGSRLVLDQERQLVTMASEYPSLVRNAAAQKNPALVINYLYDLCKIFSRYYHDNPILKNEDKVLVKTRMMLSKVVLQIIKNCFSLTGIPFLESM